MTNVIHLKQILIDALERNGETLEDILVTSIPIKLMDQMTTLEEIQCFYLNSQPDKQHIPLVVITKENLYFHHNEGRDPTHIMIHSKTHGVDFIPGVECYPIKDYEPYDQETIEYMNALQEKGML